MAAYAGLASLMSTIENIMIHPRLGASLDKYQIPSLHERAGLLLGFIEGNNHAGVMSKEFEDLERRITRAARAAEDVIESHIADQIHAGSSKASLPCLIHLQKIIEDMDSILEKANGLKEKGGLRLREEPRNSRMPLVETGATDIVGFEDELFQLMDELTSQQSSRRIISIVGMAGAGKTALAQSVFENLLIKQHFDILAWATISQQYTAQDILSQLVSAQRDSFHGILDELGLQLHKTLIGRRYLIVLDDLWRAEAWDEVRRFFPDDGNRSRVLLTTRLSNVARDCCSSSQIQMEPLDEHECWKLLCKKAFEEEACPYIELEEVGKEIARLCKGLPLSTVVIGGLLLKSPRSLQFWKNIARNIKFVPYSKEKEESLDILALSYHHLPPHLKPCFLYMGVFREDSTIPVVKIINLWIAEGFLRPNSTHTLEKVGAGYLKELIDRNLVSIRRLHWNRGISGCGIHDLVRDLCLKVGEQQEFFHVDNGVIRGTEIHLICSRGSKLEHIGRPSLARSILEMKRRYEPVNYKLLRVWDCGEHESLKALYGNFNLRYLAYAYFQDSQPECELPSSVTHLWNLQTLILVQPNTRTVIVAPIEIWKMRQLRHVQCSYIYVPPPGDGLLMMDNLQTLKLALNLRMSEQVCKIIPNINKLQLFYDSESLGYDASLIELLQNLDRLDKLKSVNLRIRVGEVPRMIKIFKFPSSLNKLTLLGCQLRWKDLSVIGSLPHLEVLKLQYDSVRGDRWSPVEGQFRSLICLLIESCDLHYWEADSSHFPVLEKLGLSDLSYLDEIPLAMGYIPTLRYIYLRKCSESAAISAIRMKKDQSENQGNDDIQIQLVICHSNQKSFEERLEMEGMKLSDIQIFEVVLSKLGELT